MIFKNFGFNAISLDFYDGISFSPHFNFSDLILQIGSPYERLSLTFLSSTSNSRGLRGEIFFVSLFHLGCLVLALDGKICVAFLYADTSMRFFVVPAHDRFCSIADAHNACPAP
ncbi:hypothetical protein KSP39_PZI019216 [Platanthera zijinensis]|uniref:Uncharacterized protein n=1 Tax=Platanthera zijinensis TaxID=2320716 RepID=A0AAP0FXQ6_9ASPA